MTRLTIDEAVQRSQLCRKHILARLGDGTIVGGKKGRAWDWVDMETLDAYANCNLPPGFLRIDIFIERSGLSEKLVHDRCQDRTYPRHLTILGRGRFIGIHESLLHWRPGMCCPHRRKAKPTPGRCPECGCELEPDGSCWCRVALAQTVPLCRAAGDDDPWRKGVLRI